MDWIDWGRRWSQKLRTSWLKKNGLTSLIQVSVPKPGQIHKDENPGIKTQHNYDPSQTTKHPQIDQKNPARNFTLDSTWRMINTQTKKNQTQPKNINNELETDLDYDEMTSQPSQNTSGSDMDDTLENEKKHTELLEYRPPDDHNNTKKMEPKTDDDQNQTRRRQCDTRPPTTAS